MIQKFTMTDNQNIQQNNSSNNTDTDTDNKDTPTCTECNKIYSEVYCVDCNKYLCTWCNSKVHVPISYRDHDIKLLYDVYQPWLKQLPSVQQQLEQHYDNVTHNNSNNNSKHADILDLSTTQLTTNDVIE